MGDRYDGLLDRYYAQSYAQVNHTGLGGKVQDLFHRRLEQPFDEQASFASVIELGATSGEHLRFVRHRFERYTLVDIRDSEEARSAAKQHSELTGADVSFVVADATDLAAFADDSVDRLVSMCLLHHLDDPLTALKNWRRVVRPGGTLSIFLPCDPGVLWRLGRALTTFRSARRLGYSRREIRYISACDHRNHVASLSWMLDAVFDGDDVVGRGYPLRARLWNLNLLHTYQVTKSPSQP
jgi:phosphatidylethanolamine/phosphatidyl-N-methylethanolamine N-methyltransferase